MEIEWLESLDIYIEQISIARALLVVQTSTYAKNLRFLLRERDYPCGLSFEYKHRFIIVSSESLLVLANMSPPVDLINVVFIIGNVDLQNVIKQTRHLLDTNFKTYILSLI